MQVSTIASGAYEAVAADADATALRSPLDSDRVAAVFVTGAGRLGVVTRRDIARSETAGETRAAAYATPVPALEPSDGLREAARALVANRVPAVPVASRSDPVGCVTRDAVLEGATDALEAMTVAEARTRSAVTHVPDTATAGARQRSGEAEQPAASGIAYGGELVGAATTGAAAGAARDQSGDGATGPPSNVDQYRPSRPEPSAATGAGRSDAAISPGAPVTSAVERMLRADRDGILVSPEGDDRVTGALTRTDVLDALAGPDRTTLDLRLVNDHLLRVTAREDVAARLEPLAGEPPTPDDSHGTVRLAVTDGGGEGRPLVRCAVRLWTGDAWRSVTAEAEGAERALSFAIERLERDVGAT